ncbi:MAG: pyridoxal phosphate-dependent aminotransferase [Clostridia bacterium]|nr:pyridoxal phosphate-dependent aminotransferase [Clostridia bacterium]
MRYDFDKVINRRHTDSTKWSVPDTELPMWVADMDFATAPQIIDALRSRTDHGIFGYTEVTDEWYEAYDKWWRERHGMGMEKESLLFCTGVVAAISSTVRKLTKPGDRVVVQTPVYNIFFNSIVNNGCAVFENRLIYDGEHYSVDFDDLEKKLSEPDVRLMILCNPHNPVGKIWDCETLDKIGELCQSHGVTVLSDEIHCDVASPGHAYVPFASVSDVCRNNSITCVSPTKAFNLAGIQTAAIYIPNKDLYAKINRAINTDEVAEPNVFATVGAVSAFTKGGEWLDQMNEYVSNNKETVCSFLHERLPGVRAVRGDATYLVWLDVSSYGNSRDVAGFLREKTGLYVTAGSVYGKNGDGFLRMNVACPSSTLFDGLDRLERGLNAFVR